MEIPKWRYANMANSGMDQTKHTEVQLLINYAYHLLSQCAEERTSPLPPETNQYSY